MIEEGRLELASGSWVMTDEANAYFPVSVDNIVEGHQFLQKELGKLLSKPKLTTFFRHEGQHNLVERPLRI